VFVPLSILSFLGRKYPYDRAYGQPQSWPRDGNRLIIDSSCFFHGATVGNSRSMKKARWIDDWL